MAGNVVDLWMGYDLMNAMTSEIAVACDDDGKSTVMLDVGHFYRYDKDTVEGEMTSDSSGSKKDEARDQDMWKVWIDGTCHDILDAVYEVLVARRFKILKTKRLITESNDGWKGKVFSMPDNLSNEAKTKKRCLVDSQVPKKKKKRFSFYNITK